MPRNEEDLQSKNAPAASLTSARGYLSDIKRGKGIFQLTAVAKSMSPSIRKRWAAGSFTGVRTDAGSFDAIICTVSYHFHKHGQRFGTIAKYTDAAVKYFEKNFDDPKMIKKEDGDVLTFKNGSSYKVKRDKKRKVSSFQILTFSGT